MTLLASATSRPQPSPLSSRASRRICCAAHQPNSWACSGQTPKERRGKEKPKRPRPRPSARSVWTAITARVQRSRSRRALARCATCSAASLRSRLPRRPISREPALPLATWCVPSRTSRAAARRRYRSLRRSSLRVTGDHRFTSDRRLPSRQAPATRRSEARRSQPRATATSRHCRRPTPARR